MPGFSARFAILACLCAVLPFTPPVEAAHIPGASYMVGKHTPPTNPPRDRSSFDGSRWPHGYHKYRTPGRRAPPLLRRPHSPDHNEARAGDKHPRSAFARSRFRRESGSLRRRSSVYFSGEHGDTYVVSRSPHRANRHSAHARTRRQVDQNNQILGRIDIMAPGGTQRLASLAVTSTPIDWTSGQTSAKAFPLSASTSNQTQFIMMPLGDANTDGTPAKHVALATEVFDAGSAEMVLYCTTYDPDPGEASALLMMPCDITAPSLSQFSPTTANGNNDNSAGAESCATPSNPHQSQIFAYDPYSGKLEPVSGTDGDGTGDHGSSGPPPCGSAVRRDTSNATTSAGGFSVKPSGTSMQATPSASPSAAPQLAQNVTLVYVAGALEVPPASPSSFANTSTSMSLTASASQSASAKPSSAGFGKAAVVTTTITTTIMATVTASESGTLASTSASSPSRTPTPTPTPIADAAVSGSTSISPTATSVTRSSSSSRASPSAVTTSAKANESLELDIVGVTLSTPSASPPSTSSSAATPGAASATASSRTGGSAANPTLDPIAVASLVANRMAHGRRGFAEALL